MQAFTYNKVARLLLLVCFLLFTLVAESAALRCVKKNIAQMGMGLPTLTINSSMTSFTEEVGGPGHIQYYDIVGSGFTTGDILVLEVGDPSGSFTISNTGSEYSSRIEIISIDGQFDEMIAVKYAPTEAGGHTATIDHSGGGAETQTLTVDGNGGALPVEWLSFKAKAVKGAFVLDWVTASEKNNSHFEVELSENPLAGFEKIGRVDSKVGNSESATHYSFEFSVRGITGTCYFRLKQVDTDEAFDYSKIITAAMSEAGGAKVSVAPNPLTASSQLIVSVAEAGKLNVFISNAGGTVVYSKTYDLDGVARKVPLYLYDELAAGMYILTTEFKGQMNRMKLIKE
jgi:hypothetical protein